jgi:hypothetical protein
MVGRPGFPQDVDRRGDLKGSSDGTPGLTALDEEREASLADEGGTSGAQVETQDEEARQQIAGPRPLAHLAEPEDVDDDDPPISLLWTLGAALAIGVLGLLVLRRA